MESRSGSRCVQQDGAALLLSRDRLIQRDEKEQHTQFYGMLFRFIWFLKNVCGPMFMVGCFRHIIYCAVICSLQKGGEIMPEIIITEKRRSDSDKREDGEENVKRVIQRAVTDWLVAQLSK